MVPFKIRTFLVQFSNGMNRTPKRPVFEWFRYLNDSGIQMSGFQIPTVFRSQLNSWIYLAGFVNGPTLKFVSCLSINFFLNLIKKSLLYNSFQRVLCYNFAQAQNEIVYRQSPIFLLLTRNLLLGFLCKYGNFSSFLDILWSFQ